MQQNGPFRVNDLPPFPHPFSKECKQWVSLIHKEPLLKTKYRAVRNQMFDLLGVTNFDEILSLINNQSLQQQTIKRAHLLLGNMFGISVNINEIKRYLDDYARTADDVINSLRMKVLAPYNSHIEMTNEIETTLDPIQLLLIFFNEKYHRKARFEAKRKLTLMVLAGSIDQRERESKVAVTFSNFLAFLNDYVWSPQLKIGDLKISYLYSKHRSDDFSCKNVRVIQEQEAKQLELTTGDKLTLIKRRSFTTKGHEIPIYVSIRKKPAAAKVLKLLRKNEKNPAVAVDDELGLMAVLNSISDVKIFLKHLTQSAVKAGSFMTLEDISDTLTGGKYTGSAGGSSSKTPMLKFFSRLGGMRVEFIIHTNESYLNYIYQREVSHDEYEVKRIFDTGVAEFLFPPDIYRLDLELIRQKQITRFRKRTEEL
jgi:hypothetical protein